MNKTLIIFAVLALVIVLGAGLYTDTLPRSQDIKSNLNIESFTSKQNLVPTEVTAMEYIEERDNLSLFYTALQEAGMFEAVSDVQTVTIFAPTNEAIEVAPDNIKALFENDPGGQLVRQILSQHIVPGAILSSYLEADEINVASLEGQPVALNKDGENVVFNGITAMQSDHLVSNGAVHIMDQLYLGQFGTLLNVLDAEHAKANSGSDDESDTDSEALAEEN